MAARLGELGFRKHSLSDIVREEAVARGLSDVREDLIAVGTSLRREHGAGVLASRILPRLGGRDVVDSIRNPAEVEVLRGRSDFVLVGVAASHEVRFERSLRRARHGDPATPAEFRRREEQENASDPSGQQLDATFRLADHVLENHGDLEALRRAVEALLARIEARARR